MTESAILRWNYYLAYAVGRVHLFLCVGGWFSIRLASWYMLSSGINCPGGMVFYILVSVLTSVARTYLLWRFWATCVLQQTGFWYKVKSPGPMAIIVLGKYVRIVQGGLDWLMQKLYVSNFSCSSTLCLLHRVI